MIMTMIIVTLGVLMIFVFIQTFLTSNSFVSDNQLTAIESGFESLKFSVFMSSSFFMLAVLFVLFDVELILLLPYVMNQLEYFIVKELLAFILSFISLTLMWEWWIHGLKWAS